MNQISLVEALMCCFVQATDMKGLRLAGPDPGYAERLAVAVIENLETFGYTIDPK